MKTTQMLAVLGLVACGCSGQTPTKLDIEMQAAKGIGNLTTQSLYVSEYFHDISPDVDGFQAKRGAITYLLDQNKSPLMGGFHSLTRLDDACNPDYDADLGACRYVITADGNVKSVNYPECLSKVILECPNSQ